MNRSTIRRVLRTGILLATAATLAVPTAANAKPATDSGTATTDSSTATASRPKTCAQKFDQAQRTDMESFRDFDWPTWIAGHSKHVVSIIADGRTRIGLDAVATASRPRFVSKDSVWSWTETTRRVNGCDSAFIVYTTKYAIPRLDYWFTAVTTVSYEYQRGRWLVVLDQGTLLEEHVGGAA
ncbi:hypothetical protein AB0P21_32720 [Kribbella sp. NPDC056861]|uniref:hypothetical protein n=1 Tax=Kribbella sp. NPDC056861 TaxID=3154857 RepID=UPI0034425D61